jgi:type IV secretion system protein VirD4
MRRRQAPPHMSVWIQGQDDPLWAARSHLATYGDALHVGMDDAGWVITRPERSLLVLGPPRGEEGTGKTSSVLIPLVLTAPGPVVSTSTKGDVLTATALARSRFGRVWHYAPDGRTETPPGASEVHWSPLQAADEWDTASITATLMVTAADTGKGVTDSTHWKTRAGDLLGPVLYFAAKTGKDLAFVLQAIHTTRVKAVLDGLRAMERDPDAHLAANVLEGVLHTSDRELSSIFSASATALSAYKLSGALRSTERPNFDPAQFVSGEPPPSERAAWERLNDFTGRDAALHRMRADTVYITSSAENQRIVAPLVIGFLAQLRKARYEQHRADMRVGLRGRPPTVLALDELFGLAPLPDLPEMLGDCGSQGLPVVGALQDLSQAEVRWDRSAQGFLTLFQDVLAFRGVKDTKTLEALSVLVGDWDRPVETSSTSTGSRAWGPLSQTTNYGYQRERILPPSAIYAGHPKHPHMALLYSGSRWQWVYTTPYYSAAPWPAVLVAAMEHMGRALQQRPDERCLLPTPELDLDEGHTLGSLGLWQRFWYAREHLRQLRLKVAAEARWAEERATAIARGEDPPPMQWRHMLAGARLLVGGKVTPAVLRSLVASFDSELQPEDKPPFVRPNTWEKRSSDGEWVEVGLESDLEDVPDMWIGQASREFRTYPLTCLWLGFNSSKGWSYARRFARLLARRFPVMWFSWIGAGYNDREVANAAERIDSGLYVVDEAGEEAG